MVDIHSYSNDSGVYGIYIDDALVYIGKAKNFHQRFGGHTSSIRHSDGQWYPLVREFDKRGHNIWAKIIEKVPIRTLCEVESRYIDELDPIFNIDGCRKDKKRPVDYDTTVQILGLKPRPPVIEIKIEQPQKNWFGEEIQFRKW